MDSDDPQQPAVGESAGKQLKKAREKLGLSVKDVADAQHLRVSIIQAIEDGDYDQIDSELFLKGYVRAYAKQVGADADALIETLDLELAPLREERAKQEQENPLVDIERRRRKKRQVAKVLVVLALIGGIAFAAWKLVLEPRTAVELQTGAELSEGAAEPETPPDVTEPAATTEVEAVVVSETPEAPALDEAAPSMSPTPRDEDADLTELAPVEEPADIQVSSVDVENDVPIEEATISSEPQAPATQPAEAVELVAQTVTDESEAELEMSFVADCWVQVRDAEGNQLLASLQRAGDEIRISGVTPLRVVIGAVDAVGSIRFSGDPVDISRSRVTNNRTELTLTP